VCPSSEESRPTDAQGRPAAVASRLADGAAVLAAGSGAGAAAGVLTWWPMTAPLSRWVWVARSGRRRAAKRARTRRDGDPAPPGKQTQCGAPRGGLKRIAVGGGRHAAPFVLGRVTATILARASDYLGLVGDRRAASRLPPRLDTLNSRRLLLDLATVPHSSSRTGRCPAWGA
jgi:hypothetical protein